MPSKSCLTIAVALCAVGACGRSHGAPAEDAAAAHDVAVADV